jgi:hypothetical protein
MLPIGHTALQYNSELITKNIITAIFYPEFCVHFFKNVSAILCYVHTM